MVRIKCCLAMLVLAPVVCLKIEAQAIPAQGLLSGYFPSFCRAAVFPVSSCELVVFLDGGRRTSIKLPLRLEFFTFAGGGRDAYALAAGIIQRINKEPACVRRVDFNPVRLTTVACPAGLVGAFAFTVSSDETRVLISGQIRNANVAGCGVFDIRLADGATRQILNAGSCQSYNFEHSWTSLSLSPDSSQGVAVRGNRLLLFHLNSAATRVIAEGIEQAEWSPDGRWIAALDTHGRTELIDVGDFKTKRTLMRSSVQWSPDSRYLLRVKVCRPQIAVNPVMTIEALDISTGQALTIESSRCTVDNGATGWISKGSAQ